ncbi:MAG: hypothetical protein IJT83_16075, partial [Victivallales bacterium]|nr:hypothetical protein [Victivallales bacterium]
ALGSGRGFRICRLAWALGSGRIIRRRDVVATPYLSHCMGAGEWALFFDGEVRFAKAVATPYLLHCTAQWWGMTTASRRRHPLFAALHTTWSWACFSTTGLGPLCLLGLLGLRISRVGLQESSLL